MSMHTRSLTAMTAALLVLVLALAGCSHGPRDISFGKEECAHCRMTITDRRFASELVTTKSKIFVFDAVECMAAFINDKQIQESDIASLWVMRYDKPGEFTNAVKAWYLRGDDVRSPMGMNLAAYATEKGYHEAEEHSEYELFRWVGVRLLVAKEM